MILTAISLLSALHLVQSTAFDHCNGNNLTIPTAVEVSNCTTQPCKLYRGLDVILVVDFEATKDIYELVTMVKADALGVETIYPLPNPDVCSSLINGECPLDKGEEVTYKLIMPVLPSFPKVHVVIQFFLNSGTDTIACFKIATELVDP